jgi:hypothetical protein
MRRGHLAVGGVVLFAFSLTTEALAKKLRVAYLPHMHAEIPAAEPRLTFTVPSVTGAQTASVSHSADAYIA